MCTWEPRRSKNTADSIQQQPMILRPSSAAELVRGMKKLSDLSKPSQAPRGLPLRLEGQTQQSQADGLPIEATKRRRSPCTPIASSIVVGPDQYALYLSWQDVTRSAERKSRTATFPTSPSSADMSYPDLKPSWTKTNRKSFYVHNSRPAPSLSSDFPTISLQVYHPSSISTSVPGRGSERSDSPLARAAIAAQDSLHRRSSGAQDRCRCQSTIRQAAHD